MSFRIFFITAVVFVMAGLLGQAQQTYLSL